MTGPRSRFVFEPLSPDGRGTSESLLIYTTLFLRLRIRVLLKLNKNAITGYKFQVAD
jgi:hypothetical protein